jgi:hypothetical protein
MSGFCASFPHGIKELEGDGMFHTKDHKTGDLFEPLGFLGPRRRKRIKQSWAELFRKEILSELPVGRLRKHYAAQHGRPSKELYALLGAVLLQQMLDLTDEEVVDQFAFNLQWHYALNITGDSDQAAYLCPKTLWSMRALVAEEELDSQMFEQVTAKLARVFGVATERQRMDSVHIFSNMRHLGRVALIAQTIRKFLVNLKRRHPELWEELEEDLRQRYGAKSGEGVFGLVKPSESEQTLRVVAQDLFDLMQRFSGRADVSGMHSYRLLARVFSEHCRVEEPPDGGKRIEVKSNREVPSDSLQNPSDPDASYSGHKGKGYQVQVMESYSEETAQEETPALNLITYVAVQRAHESDSLALLPALGKTRELGLAPQQLLADAMYGGDENFQRSRAQGVELVAPVKSNKPPEGLAEFSFDRRHRVTKCPQGQVPLKTRENKERHRACFDRAVCEQCPCRDRCPARPGRRGYYLRYTRKQLRLEQRKAHEQSDEFRNHYRYRSGSEATMSEIDRKTGMKHLRVRGMTAVRLCVFLKAAGVNILRAARHQGRFERPENTLKGLVSRVLTPLYRGVTKLQRRFAAVSGLLAGLQALRLHLGLNATQPFD